MASESPASNENLFEVNALKKYFPIKSGTLVKRVKSAVRAVDNVDLNIKRGSVFGVVGESGCGKSTLARVLMDLIPASEGSIMFDGISMLDANKQIKRQLRRRMNIVFQDPFGSLDPTMTIAQIVTEPMVSHKTETNKKNRLLRAVHLIEQCGLFADQIFRYPHQFSGGQRQRICIARALAASPEFIACDEAVSALDVSIQAQIINLLLELKDRHNLTYMFISHDLNVVRFISDEVAVMYLGEVVEKAPKEQLFANPKHPYTIALLESVPNFDMTVKTERRILEGDVPNPANPPSGCRFHTRCPKARDECKTTPPKMVIGADGHGVKCHLFT